MTFRLPIPIKPAQPTFAEEMIPSSRQEGRTVIDRKRLLTGVSGLFLSLSLVGCQTIITKTSDKFFATPVEAAPAKSALKANQSAPVQTVTTACRFSAGEAQEAGNFGAEDDAGNSGEPV